jgi:hypothetical protein
MPGVERRRPGALSADRTAAALARCKARLDALRLYPRPVRLRFVRVIVTPWLFRLPWFRRFDGYTMWDWIFLRRPLGAGSSEDLLCHELCHVWQMQHHPVRMPLSFVRHGYDGNPYEREARRATTASTVRENDKPGEVPPSMS